MYRTIIAFILLASTLSAHEMTPTYPKMRLSYLEGAYETTMMLFNRRPEVSFYSIDVFDENFEPIPFATPYRIIQVDHLQREQFSVYIRSADLDRATYICTSSKIARSNTSRTAVASRICSKIRKD